MMDEQRVMRLLAWLLRNEGVEPEAVERAVRSAVDMRPGDPVTLEGDGSPLRRAFVFEQTGRLFRQD